MDQKSTPPKPLIKLENRLNSANDSRPSPTDSESDTDHAPTSWPRFLVIKPNNKENTFLTVSPFAINKALLGIAGEMKSIRKLGSGDLMVETSRKSHSDNLLKCKMFINFPVTVSPHRSLNSSRGIIRHREFKFCSDEEVQENLSSKGVTDVKRISVTRDGKKCPTNTFILTFNNSTLPSSIKIAWFNVAVEPYIPNPLRCFNCQRFGHHKDKCKCKLVCARCGGEGHEADGCTKTFNVLIVRASILLQPKPALNGFPRRKSRQLNLRRTYLILRRERLWKEERHRACRMLLLPLRQYLLE